MEIRTCLTLLCDFPSLPQYLQMKWPLLDVPGSAGLKDSRSPTPGHLVSAGIKTCLNHCGCFTSPPHHHTEQSTTTWLQLGFLLPPVLATGQIYASVINLPCCWILSCRRELVIIVSLWLHNVGPSRTCLLGCWCLFGSRALDNQKLRESHLAGV